MSGVLALTKFELTPRGDGDGRYVSIRCRRRGLRALIRTALGLDLNVSLDVKRDAVQFKDLSLFEETYRTIPITAVRAVNAGLRRPFWKLAYGVLFVIASVAFFVLAGVSNILGEAASTSDDAERLTWLISGGASLLIGGMLLVLYMRQKRLFIEFDYGGASNRLEIQRSWHVVVSVTQVRKAVEVINSLVVGAHPVAPEVAAEAAQGDDGAIDLEAPTSTALPVG